MELSIVSSEFESYFSKCITSWFRSLPLRISKELKITKYFQVNFSMLYVKIKRQLSNIDKCYKKLSFRAGTVVVWCDKYLFMLYGIKLSTECLKNRRFGVF